MDHQFLNFNRSAARAISSSMLRFELEQEAEEDRLSVQAPSSVWPLVVAALALLGMLLVFHYVVRQAFQQGELRHKAVAVHAAAIWRCNNLQGRDVSDRCLVQAGADARRVALTQFKDAPLARVATQDLSPPEDVHD